MLRTARQVLLVAGPKVAGGALTLALNVVLLSVWPPEHYAVYALCTTVILLVDAVLGSSLDMATLRLASAGGGNEDSLATQRAALQIKLVGCAAALPILALASRPLSQALFGTPAHMAVLVVTFAATVALLLLRSMLIHAQIAMRFRAYALLEVVHASVKFGGVGLLLLLAASPPVGALLVTYVAGPAAAFAVGLAQFRDAGLVSLRPHAERVRELVRYARWYAASGAAGNAISRLDLFVLAAVASPREVGLFAGAQTFATVLGLGAGYLAVVLNPRIMPLLEHGGYRGFHRRVQLALYAVAAVVLVVALALLDDRLIDLFPDAFRESSDLLRILLVGTTMSFATIPLALPLVMFRRPRLTLVMDVVAAPVIVLLYWLAIAAHGTQGAAWVTTASLLVRGAIVQAVAWRLSAAPLASGEARQAEGLQGRAGT